MKKSLLLIVITLLVASVPASLDAKSKKKSHRRAAKEQVWTCISGTYSFSNGEITIVIDHFRGESKASISKCDYSEEEDYKCTVNEKTGLITIYDNDGKIIFVGKMYRGGNQLKGTLNGKKVILEGMCGL